MIHEFSFKSHELDPALSQATCILKGGKFNIIKIEMSLSIHIQIAPSIMEIVQVPLYLPDQHSVHGIYYTGFFSLNYYLLSLPPATLHYV